MKNKSNEATPQRPEGDRLLNAPLVEMDLNEYIEQITKEQAWANSDHNSITLFKTKSMRIVLMGMQKNAELKTHDTKAIISVQVLEGRLDFITVEKTATLTKGQMIGLQSKIPHSVLARTETFFLLTFAFS